MCERNTSRTIALTNYNVICMNVIICAPIVPQKSIVEFPSNVLVVITQR